jgi:hypothetical protein
MVRNIIGVIVGIIVSMAVNMSLIFIGYAVIPPPAGADVNTMEGLASTIHLFEPKNFIFPFLAHALGPLVGTFVTMLIAVSSKMKIAIGMAVLFLLLGIWANVVIPAPLWYHVVDILFAYIPTTLIGAKLGGAGKET